MTASEKEIRRFLRECEDEGLEYEMGGGGHWKVTGTNPDSGRKFVVTVSQTPKNPHTAVKQAKRDLRRNGVSW